MFDRTKALSLLAEFLHQHFPSVAETESKRLGISMQQYKTIQLNNKIGLIAAKARLNLTWRKKLSQRLSLHEDEIIRATNTVLEIIEEVLLEGGAVKLKTLGDFSVVAGLPRFKMSSLWNRELGNSTLGLIKPTGRLTRTNVSPA